MPFLGRHDFKILTGRGPATDKLKMVFLKRKKNNARANSLFFFVREKKAENRDKGGRRRRAKTRQSRARRRLEFVAWEEEEQMDRVGKSK
jgi:hypothetical protein